MARDKSKKSIGLGRASLHLLGVVLFFGALAAATVFTKRYVDQRVAGPTGPLKVAIKDTPVWMSDFLAEQIAATVPRNSSSAFDRDLLIAAADRLRENPWVENVRQVRRVYGERPGDTLEIDCDFRAPIALVEWGKFYWLVDGEGVKLPEQFNAAQVPGIVVARDQKMNIRIIDGVRQPPPDTGRRWAGQDLAAGLGVAKLLYGKPFAEEIVTINVANFAGRVDQREAQIVFWTKYATQVRWGRPLDAKDFFAEVPANQKLSEMASIVKQYGRVDAGRPWIDIRYDKITYPTPLPHLPLQ
jgi:hypothetical protein